MKAAQLLEERELVTATRKVAKLLIKPHTLNPAQMVPVRPHSEANMPSWLEDHGTHYGEFTQNFVAARQPVFALGGNPVRGSENFGAHVSGGDEGGQNKVQGVVVPRTPGMPSGEGTQPRTVTTVRTTS